MSKPIENLMGHKFGKLTVIEFVGRLKNKTMWKCLCSCGVKVNVQAGNLKSGHSNSCGCNKDSSEKVTHGHKRRLCTSRTYSTWRNMWNRCTNPKMDNYKYYGGRGITICDRWKDFNLFLADMGERPEGMFIDRINNNKGYSPENCKWSDRIDQGQNKNPYGNIINIDNQEATNNV